MKIKYKGAYTPTGAHEKGELGWHQNHSALVIQKAVSAAIINGTPVRKFIYEHKDPYDFMLLCKSRKSDRLELHKPLKWGNDIVNLMVKVSDIQGVTRYYVAKEGYNLIKVMPPIKRTGKNVKMMIPSWTSKKIEGKNKNYEASLQHPEHYQMALRLGYVIKDGGSFTHTKERKNEVEAGYLIQPTNRYENEDIFDNVDYDYYIKKAEELVSNLSSVG